MSTKLCAHCIYADYVDYNSMQCQKGIAEDRRRDCTSFKSQEEHTAEEQIKVEHETVTKEIQKQFLKRYVTIENTDGKTPNQIDHRFYTKSETPVYNTTFSTLAKSHLPKGQLVSFTREMIRDNRYLLMKKEGDSTTYFDPKDKTFTICRQILTKEQEIDIILISHDDFDNNVLIVDDSKEVKEEYQGELESLIDKESSNINIRIIDQLITNGIEKSIMKQVVLRNNVSKIELGKVASHTKMYITENTQYDNVFKIITADGREGIMLNQDYTYTFVESNTDQIISILSIVILGVLGLFVLDHVLKNSSSVFIWYSGYAVVLALMFLLLKTLITLVVTPIRLRL
ncbi:hypothetical protein [Flammeovirga aprica]|uniref:Uncharacterized protein n=1 Tax=Flammeovirga aprica JL-4 TaxID=694437 RepID=A0A7X9RYE3_9BACT|nr:hypothetical protein [Flammeovirga aprica]NME71057.1 hypothetical protein [Flammeovirga aprica JL-4]